MPEIGRGSIAETLALGPQFVAAAKDAFTHAMTIAMVAGAIGAVAGAIVALIMLPSRKAAQPPPPAPDAQVDVAVSLQ